ncbi:MAG: DUF2461 domain-containing protein [Pseudomonadota bacterium]
MAPQFDDLIHDAQRFFAQLEVNNNKAWFAEQKATYQTTIQRPAELLADHIATTLTSRSGSDFRPKIFRIYRDVRFAKDKSPYNPWLHILCSRADGAAAAPGWFFACNPHEVSLTTGLMGLSTQELTRFRSYINTNGDALASVLSEARDGAGATHSDWGPPPLKRVPSPYAQDHTHADLLRRKSLLMSAPLDLSDGFEAGLSTSITTLLPLWRELQENFSNRERSAA